MAENERRPLDMAGLRGLLHDTWRNDALAQRLAVLLRRWGVPEKVIPRGPSIEVVQQILALADIDPDEVAGITQLKLETRIYASSWVQSRIEQDTSGQHANPKGQTVNDRMKAELAANLEAVKGWSAKQWAAHLGCAKSTVAETETWKSLSLMRTQAKAERRRDRRRK